MRVAGPWWIAIAAVACSAPARVAPPPRRPAPIAEPAPVAPPATFPAAPVMPRRPASTSPVVQIAAGGEVACARHADGAVSCWGDNDAGQLGDPPYHDARAARDKRTVRDTPAGAPLADALDIATDGRRTCIRRADGVWCWGSPAGELDHIGGVDGAVDLTPGCVRDAAGAVRCWHDLLVAGAEPGITGALDVATDAYRTCAVMPRGRIECWDNEARVGAEAVKKVKGAVEVVVAGDHRCVRTAAGGVACWMGFYYLGFNANGGRPTRIPVADALQVVVGPDFGCARLAGGAVTCWGHSPALAKDKLVSPQHPEVVDGVVADELAAGDGFVCARTGGEVACWGDNERGQLGIGWSHVRVAPIEVPGITDAVGVVVHNQYSCARRRSGAVSCWGRLDADSETPAEVPSLHDAVALTGDVHPCGRFSDGSIRCRGEDALREAGSAVADAAVCDTHSVAVLADGTAASFGYDTAGQFALGDAGPGYGPVLIPGVDDAIAVGVARGRTCVVRRGGTVECAGLLFSDPDPRTTSTPATRNRLRAIAGIAKATAVAITDDHACAVIADGTVACWGVATDGQLGPGVVGLHEVAVAIPGVDHVVQVAVTTGTTCARRDDGTVLCWGRNDTGVLGDAAAVAWSADPIQLPLAGVVDLSIAEHACAALATGAVACWGRSDNGQVGTLRSGRILVPTAAALP